MMSKVQYYYRSKRFISQMTTVLRALQFSMNMGTTIHLLAKENPIKKKG